LIVVEPFRKEIGSFVFQPCHDSFEDYYTQLIQFSLVITDAAFLLGCKSTFPLKRTRINAFKKMLAGLASFFYNKDAQASIRGVSTLVESKQRGSKGRRGIHKTSNR
jgi:hypothetical protein